MRSYFSALLLLLLFLPVVDAQAGLLLGREDREKEERRAGKARQSVDGPWLMTYYVGYQNHYLKPRDVDYSLMTHIVVGGVSVNSDGTLDEHWHLSNGDTDDGRDMAEDVGRRADREGVKKLVWLGGPNEEDKFYSASSKSNRARFVENIVELVEDLDYDGVDIDWEPIRAKDEEHVLRLVRDLRKAAPDMLITIPVNWVPTTIAATKDLDVYDEMASYVDKFFVMSYSMAGPWPGWDVWHGGALKGDTWTTPGSVRTSIYAYERAGVPEDQLGIGIGTYATCWEFPVRKPRQDVPSGFAPKHIGVTTMRDIEKNYYKQKYEKWDAKAQVPYLSLPRATGEWDCGFISYENEKSVEAKMEYVLESDLGGAIIWNIGTGYYPDKSRSKRHPLLKAAADTLGL